MDAIEIIGKAERVYLSSFLSTNNRENELTDIDQFYMRQKPPINMAGLFANVMTDFQVHLGELTEYTVEIIYKGKTVYLGNKFLPGFLPIEFGPLYINIETKKKTTIAVSAKLDINDQVNSGYLIGQYNFRL